MTRIVARTGHPDFLDLPWDLPLATWDIDRLVRVPRGVHRHVVRFVGYDDRIYALKELPDHLVENEYAMLRFLHEESVPAVDPVARVLERDGLDGVVVTEHLPFSIPYRILLPAEAIAHVRDRMLDAMAGLLVRLHLAGFYWGDGSLSNTLFRRDAGSLVAYLVDAETGQRHPSLSDALREHDLDITVTNVGGGLLDLQAADRLPDDIDPFDTADELGRRYRHLWHELTSDEVVATDERWRIGERLQRLNELGYDVEELELIETAEGYRLHLSTHVVEPGHHTRLLERLTGLHTEEQQARRLINDIHSYAAHLERLGGDRLHEALAAGRWRTDVFEPAMARVPDHLRNKLQPPELFLAMLDHWRKRAEERDGEVDLFDMIDVFVAEELPTLPDGRTLFVTDEHQESSV